MKTVVTGGAGFIGSHLVELLISRGDQVLVVDDFSHGKRENLEFAADSELLTIVDGSILEIELTELLKSYKPEVVFHLAAQIDVRESVAHPLDDAELNILGVIRLAQACVEAGVRKVVHTSSGGAIYGVPKYLPVGEDHPVDPCSPYAASKYAGEIYWNTFANLYGLECTHVAPSNVYGPRQDPHGEAGVVAIFTQALLAGEPTKIFGKGANTRDYVYVKDVARAFQLAAGQIGNKTRINVATGIETSDRQLHSLIARQCGADDSPNQAPVRIGDLPKSALSNERAQRIFGWSPEFSLEQGISETVNYFKRSL